MSRNTSYYTSQIAALVAAAFRANHDLLPREINELAREGRPISVPASAPVLAGYVEFHETGFEFRRPGIDQVEGVRAFLFLTSDESGEPSGITAWAPQIGRLESWLGKPRMVEGDKLESLERASGRHIYQEKVA